MRGLRSQSPITPIIPAVQGVSSPQTTIVRADSAVKQNLIAPLLGRLPQAAPTPVAAWSYRIIVAIRAPRPRRAVRHGAPKRG